MATESDRTMASASTSGTVPRSLTSDCSQRSVSASSPSEKLSVAVGRASACGASASPFSPTEPKRIELRRICRASVVSIIDNVSRASTSSRNSSKSSRVTASWNSRR